MAIFRIANAHGFTANICPNSICTWFLVLLYRNSRFKTNAPHIHHPHEQQHQLKLSLVLEALPDHNYDFCISNQPCYFFFLHTPTIFWLCSLHSTNRFTWIPFVFFLTIYVFNLNTFARFCHFRVNFSCDFFTLNLISIIHLRDITIKLLLFFYHCIENEHIQLVSDLSACMVEEQKNWKLT